MPKVSVLVPTYNYARYLPQCIESVLSQDYCDFELIIVDDCSTDDTVEVVGRYLRGDDRIRFEVNSVNAGMVRNWNRCLSEARGEYVKFLFGDDMLASDGALGEMARILDSEPSVALVSSSRNVVDAESRHVGILSHFKGGARMKGTDVVNLCLTVQKNLVGEPSVVMFRRDRASRGFDERYRQFVDMEMWFHILEQGDFYYIGEALSSFRSHPAQQTVKNKTTQDSMEDIPCLLDDYMEKEYINVGVVFKAYLMYDRYYDIWRSYKKKKIIGKAEALEKIGQRYGLLKFFSFLPVYKLAKPLINFRKHFRAASLKN